MKDKLIKYIKCCAFIAILCFASFCAGSIMHPFSIKWNDPVQFSDAALPAVDFDDSGLEDMAK